MLVGRSSKEGKKNEEGAGAAAGNEGRDEGTERKNLGGSLFAVCASKRRDARVHSGGTSLGAVAGKGVEGQGRATHKVSAGGARGEGSKRGEIGASGRQREEVAGNGREDGGFEETIPDEHANGAESGGLGLVLASWRVRFHAEKLPSLLEFSWDRAALREFFPMGKNPTLPAPASLRIQTSVFAS